MQRSSQASGAPTPTRPQRRPGFQKIGQFFMRIAAAACQVCSPAQKCQVPPPQDKATHQEIQLLKPLHNIERQLAAFQAPIQAAEFRHHLSMPDAPGAARILHDYASGEQWGWQPGAVASVIGSSLQMGGWFGAGHLKARFSILQVF